MPNRDLILLETVKTHRARLTSAFVYGALADRRIANDNTRRLLGGIVLAAVICAGCVGVSLVSSLLGSQDATARAQQGMGPATGPVVAADTFDRSVATGWGSAERGGRWQLSGAADSYGVAGGTGRITLSGEGRRGGYLPSVLQDRSDVTVTVQRTSAARSGDLTLEVLARRVSSTQDYHAAVRLAGDGSLAISLVRRSDPERDEPAEQTLSPTVILFGPVQDPAQQVAAVSVRVQAIGTNDTTLRAKAWLAGGAEPTGWTVTGSDGTAGLQRPGSVGLTAQSTGSGGEVGLGVLDVVDRTAP